MDEESSKIYSSHRKVDTATKDNHLEYCRRLKYTIELIIRQMFEDIQNVETSINVIVMWGSDTKSHQLTVKKTIDICKSNNVTFNREKWQIAIEKLTFLGDRLTANRLKLDPANMKPIVEF